jgi:hypothetical protein
MKLDALTTSARPWLQLWAAPTTDVTTALRAWELDAPGKRVARILRGRKCTSVANFFDEAAAALQFPDYFGENWDAFNDCFSDLGRFGAKTAMAICVTEADKLLGTAPAGAARTFAEVMNETLAAINAPAKPGKPRPFHVILQVRPEVEPAARKRWSAAGLNWD